MNLLLLQVDFRTHIVHFDIVSQLSDALLPSFCRGLVLEDDILELDVDHILSAANDNGFVIDIIPVLFYQKLMITQLLGFGSWPYIIHR